MRRIALLPVLVGLLVAGPGRTTSAEDAPRRARVVTKEEGFLRVRAKSLQALGLGPASEVRVTRRGRPVPALGDGEGGLCFLSVDPGTAASAWSIFQLEPGGASAPAVAPASDPSSEDRPLVATRTLDEDRVYGSVEAAEVEVYAPDRPVPVWYLARVPPGGGWKGPLDPMGAEPASEQRLTAKVVGTHPGPVALSASWGGRDLGTARADSAAGGAELTWTVAKEALPAQAAELVLRDASPPPPPAPPRDVSDDRGTVWIDSIHLSGPVSADLDERLLRLRAPTQVSLRLPAEKPLFAVLVGTDGTWTSWVWRRKDAVRVVAAKEGDLYVSGHAIDVEPVAHSAPRADPLATAGEARHVVLATEPLLEDARRLAAHRTRSGLPSAAVPVSEVYEAYAGGERDGSAIRDFVRALSARETPLEFLVLAGDATVDRTDLAPVETIPAAMARTMYNGATPADRLYGLPASGDTGGVSVGRLPFRSAEEMRAYVDRVIAYETKPAADASRKMLRFVTGEGRFSAQLDTMIENYFGSVIAKHIPDPYDVEVTYARVDSPYTWPAPEFNRKVIDGMNAGGLVYAYIGHGFYQGFDSIQVADERHPILTVADAPRVDVKGNLPAVIVLACSTGAFDLVDRDGIGEALMKRPRGPIAYYGATRICHPATNGVLGRSIAIRLFEDPERRRIGEILDAARDETIDPQATDVERTMIVTAMRMFAAGQDMDRILLEGTWMYGLLGDPAVELALPPSDLRVVAEVTPGEPRKVVASVEGPLEDGTAIRVRVEVPRNVSLTPTEKVENPLDPAGFDRIRENHRRANDKGVAEGEAVAKDGKARVEIVLPADTRLEGLIVKAFAVSGGSPHIGSARVDDL